MILINSSGKHAYPINNFELYVARLSIFVRNVYTGDQTAVATFDSSVNALAALEDIIDSLRDDCSVYNLSYSNGVIHDT